MTMVGTANLGYQGTEKETASVPTRREKATKLLPFPFKYILLLCC